MKIAMPTWHKVNHPKSWRPPDSRLFDILASSSLIYAKILLLNYEIIWSVRHRRHRCRSSHPSSFARTCRQATFRSVNNVRQCLWDGRILSILVRWSVCQFKSANAIKAYIMEKYYPIDNIHTNSRILLHCFSSKKSRRWKGALTFLLEHRES